MDFLNKDRANIDNKSETVEGEIFEQEYEPQFNLKFVNTIRELRGPIADRDPAKDRNLLVYDSEDVCEGGQLMVANLESCVGYVLYIPSNGKAYGGHFNTEIPETLRYEEDEELGKVKELAQEKKVFPFILGGEKGDELSERMIADLAKKMQFIDGEGPPTFCGSTIGPKSFIRASGIAVDTEKKEVRLLINKEDAEHRINKMVLPQMEAIMHGVPFQLPQKGD